MAVRKEQGSTARQPAPRNGGRKTTRSSAEIDTRTPISSFQPAHPDVTSDGGPTEDEIRRRAYEIYLERGEGPGDPQEDWRRAEQELRAERGLSSRSQAF